MAKSEPLNRSVSPRVAILTNAGGPAILCADACEVEGLRIPELAEGTLEALRAVLPAEASPAKAGKSTGLKVDFKAKRELERITNVAAGSPGPPARGRVSSGGAGPGGSPC